jgi:hypothetical protein
MSKTADYFRYLDALRESGVANMYGASRYLEDEFPELKGKAARDVLSNWMKTFDPDLTPEQRASPARPIEG